MKQEQYWFGVSRYFVEYDFTEKYKRVVDVSTWCGKCNRMGDGRDVNLRIARERGVVLVCAGCELKFKVPKERYNWHEIE